jgi:hypothetical protein
MISLRLVFMKRRLLGQFYDSLDVCTGNIRQVNIDFWMVQVFVNDGCVCRSRGKSIGGFLASEEHKENIRQLFLFVVLLFLKTE